MGIKEMRTSLDEYIKDLEKRLQAHYDIETHKIISTLKLDIYAISVIEHFRNIFSKKIQIDHYQEKEIILVKGFDRYVQEQDVNQFSRLLIQVTREHVSPSFDVMSHTINGILISSQGFSREAIRLAEQFRYSRTFFLGIKGWCDIRFLLIDLPNTCLYCNPKGKEVKTVYSPEKAKEVGRDSVKNGKIF